MSNSTICPPGYSHRDAFEYFDDVCIDQSWYDIAEGIILFFCSALVLEALFFCYHARHRWMERQFQNRDLLLLQAIVGGFLRISLSIVFLHTKQTLADGDTGLRVLYMVSTAADYFNNITFNSLLGVIFASIIGSPIKETILRWNNIIRWTEILLWLWGIVGTLLYGIFHYTYWIYITMAGFGLFFFSPTFFMASKIFFYDPPTSYTQDLSDFRIAQRRIFFFAILWQMFGLALTAASIFLGTSQDRHIYASARYIQFVAWMACEFYGIAGLLSMFWYKKDVQSTLKRMPSKMSFSRENSSSNSGGTLRRGLGKDTSETDFALTTNDGSA